MPSHAALRPVFLAVLCAGAAFAQEHRAKIVVEGGAQLPGVPLVMALPPNMLVGQCQILNIFGDGTVAYRVPWVQGSHALPDGCRITIRLTGYHTTDATLTDGSTVVLKRIGDHEGSTVSVTSLKAPKDARKAYQRGLSALNHKKYEEAVTDLQAAVAAYPPYAQAWSDLGEAQLALKQPANARTSWENAVQADPQYLKPYVELARLAVTEGRDQDALAVTGRAFPLNPVEFPAIYFYDAVANFHLEHYDAAEKSALAAIANDTNHEMPVAESLLGSILALKGQYAPAIEHFLKYLELSPKAADAAAIRKRIEDLQSRTDK